MEEIKIIDSMRRRDILNSVCTLIKNEFDVDTSSFIMIEGEWGSGKSFFLNLLKERLNEEEYIQKNGIIIDYNCWEDSYYDDPLTAILVRLQDVFSNKQLNFNDESKEKINMIIDGMFSLLAIGGGIFELPKNIKRNLYKNIKNNTLKKQINELKKCLYEDFKDYKIILFVDELDRCLPKYSIKTLERLYLLFKNAPNFTVIIGNNSKQLEFSIKNIFGENVEYKRYLEKFIDHYFFLHYNEIDIDNFMSNHDFYFNNFIFLDNGWKKDKHFIVQMLKKLSARKREEVIRNAYVLNNNIYTQNSKHESYLCILEILMEIINPEEFLVKLNNCKGQGINIDDDILFPFFKYALNIIDKRYIKETDIKENDIPIFKFFASIKLIIKYMIEMNLYSSNYPENEGYLNLLNSYDPDKYLESNEKLEIKQLLTAYSQTELRKEKWR
ncbi:MAG: P-loop NTPase fold protein [Coprobacillus sp.]